MDGKPTAETLCILQIYTMAAVVFLIITSISMLTCSSVFRINVYYTGQNFTKNIIIVIYYIAY